MLIGFIKVVMVEIQVQNYLELGITLNSATTRVSSYVDTILHSSLYVASTVVLSSDLSVSKGTILSSTLSVGGHANITSSVYIKGTDVSGMVQHLE